MARAFRIFVSSTFADFQREREVLQRDVFPRLADLCARRGVRFQAVDLRWGITRAAVEDRQTTAICLQEMNRCRAVGTRPYLIMMLGNRYGSCPLPVEIATRDFEAILAAIPAEDKSGAHARELLKAFYRPDLNGVLPIHVLRPQTGSRRDWKYEELLVQTLFAATSGLAWRQRVPYVASVTEQEIWRGIFDIKYVPGSALAVFRDISGIRVEDANAQKFIDLNADGSVDSRRQAMQRALRERVKRVIGEDLLSAYPATWNRDRISDDHLGRLSNDIHDAVERRILEEFPVPGRARRHRSNSTDDERAQHAAFGRNRIAFADGTSFFVGQQPEMDRALRYISSRERTPLVVCGPGGAGKTAFMAHLAGRASDSGVPVVIVQRFIGATPGSSDTRGLLLSICAEIAAVYGFARRTGSEDRAAAVRELLRLTELIPAERPLLLLVDGIDQLRDDDHPATVDWLPAELPVSVRAILSAADGPSLDALRFVVPASAFIRLRPLRGREGKELLRNWLAGEGRVIQPAQQRIASVAFAATRLPLQLRLIFEETRRWRSFERGSLAPSVPGMIDRLLRRLSRRSQHGSVMVERSVGYLLAAKHGVAHEELLAALSADREVMADFIHRSPGSPQVDALPDIVWSRLYFDLAPYLMTRPGQGTELLDFYHRLFRETLQNRQSAGDAVKYSRKLSAFFEQQPLRAGGEDGPLNLRKLAELPFLLARAGERKKLVDTLGRFPFLRAKAEGMGPQEILGDFSLLASIGGSTSTTQRDVPLGTLRRTLEASVHVVRNDVSQLAGQLMGRLLRDRAEDARRLIHEIHHWRGETWLCPLTQSLASRDTAIRTLGRHDDGISALAVNAAHGLVVCGARDKTVRLWHLESDRQQILRGHRNWVKSVAITEDGTRIISGGFDRTVRVWRSWSNEPPIVLRPSGRVWCVALFPDDRRLAVATGSRVEIWDLHQRARLRLLGRHRRGDVCAVCVPRRGGVVLSLGEDQTLRAWDAASGKAATVLRGEDHATGPTWQENPEGGGHTVHYEWEPYALETDAGGETVFATRGDHSIRARRVVNGREIRSFVGHESQVTDVALSSNGRRLLSAGGLDRTVRLWDVSTGTSLRTFQHHTDAVMAVAFAGDGRLAVSAGEDRSVVVFDIDASAERAPDLPHAASVVAVGRTRHRFASASEDGRIVVWEARTGRKLWELAGNNETLSSLLIADGSEFIVCSIGKYGYSLSRGRLRPRSEVGHISSAPEHGYSRMVPVPGGQFVAAAGWGMSNLLDLKTLQPVRELPLASTWLAVTPDGKYALGPYRDTIRAVPLDGSRPRTLATVNSRIESASLAPGGKELVCVTDESVETWRIDGRAQRVRQFPIAGASKIEISPDGKYLATASYRDRTVDVWSALDGEKVASFTTLGSPTAHTFSADSRTIIVGEETGRVHLLRIVTRADVQGITR